MVLDKMAPGDVGRVLQLGIAAVSFVLVTSLLVFEKRLLKIARGPLDHRDGNRLPRLGRLPPFRDGRGHPILHLASRPILPHFKGPRFLSELATG